MGFSCKSADHNEIILEMSNLLRRKTYMVTTHNHLNLLFKHSHIYNIVIMQDMPDLYQRKGIFMTLFLYDSRTTSQDKKVPKWRRVET